jgi:hypothetical protein
VARLKPLLTPRTGPEIRIKDGRGKIDKKTGFSVSPARTQHSYTGRLLKFTVTFSGSGVLVHGSRKDSKIISYFAVVVPIDPLSWLFEAEIVTSSSGESTVAV